MSLKPQEQFLLSVLEIYTPKDKAELSGIIEDMKSKGHRMPYYSNNSNSNVNKYLSELSGRGLLSDLEITKLGKMELGEEAKITVKSAKYLSRKVLMARA